MPSSTQFWSCARKGLEETETRLADFRTQFQGRLPDQVEANQQMMNSLQTRLSMVQSNMSRAGQDQMFGGQEVVMQRGGAGGTTGAGSSSMDVNSCGNGGGGGGATGRIFLRSRGPVAQNGATLILPAPLASTNL